VIGRTAAGDGVLIELSQSGGRLASVEDARAAAFYLIHGSARRAGDPAHAHHEIQRRPLADQNRRGIAFDGRDDLARLAKLPVGRECFEAQ